MIDALHILFRKMRNLTQKWRTKHARDPLSGIAGVDTNILSSPLHADVQAVWIAWGG
jgi:hypothetical protein